MSDRQRRRASEQLVARGLALHHRAGTATQWPTARAVAERLHYLALPWIVGEVDESRTLDTGVKVIRRVLGEYATLEDVARAHGLDISPQASRRDRGRR